MGRLSCSARNGGEADRGRKLSSAVAGRSRLRSDRPLGRPRAGLSCRELPRSWDITPCAMRVRDRLLSGLTPESCYIAGGKLRPDGRAHRARAPLPQIIVEIAKVRRERQTFDSELLGAGCQSCRGVLVCTGIENWL